ncbi:MAG: hypothetical protein R3E02_13785 [Blastomonas sp.]
MPISSSPAADEQPETLDALAAQIGSLGQVRNVLRALAGPQDQPELFQAGSEGQPLSARLLSLSASEIARIRRQCDTLAFTLNAGLSAIRGLPPGHAAAQRAAALLDRETRREWDAIGAILH